MNPQGLFPTMGWEKECWEGVGAGVGAGALVTSGNWKTSLGEEGVPPVPLCFRTPISVKDTSSGDEGWELEEGDWVWYPLEGLPGLGLALPEDPA